MLDLYSALSIDYLIFLDEYTVCELETSASERIRSLEVTGQTEVLGKSVESTQDLFVD